MRDSAFAFLFLSTETSPLNELNSLLILFCSIVTEVKSTDFTGSCAKEQNEIVVKHTTIRSNFFIYVKFYKQLTKMPNVTTMAITTIQPLPLPLPPDQVEVEIPSFSHRPLRILLFSS